MDRRPRVSFLSPPDDRQVFGLLPRRSDQSSSQDRVTELIIEKFPLPSISSNISRCICCSLCNWLTVAIPLRQSHLCKCCFIDDPLLTELVHNWWTGRMETQSITLAVYLWQAGRSNLNLKPSSFDCFIATWPTDFAAWSVARAGVLKKAQRQGSLGFWGGGDIEKHAGDDLDLSHSRWPSAAPWRAAGALHRANHLISHSEPDVNGGPTCTLYFSTCVSYSDVKSGRPS